MTHTFTFVNQELEPVMPPLQAHAAKIFCMAHHGHYIWTGSFDKVISIWDPDSYQLVQELKGHTV